MTGTVLVTGGASDTSSSTRPTQEPPCSSRCSSRRAARCARWSWPRGSSRRGR